MSEASVGSNRLSPQMTTAELSPGATTTESCVPDVVRMGVNARAGMENVTQMMSESGRATVRHIAFPLGSGSRAGGRGWELGFARGGAGECSRPRESRLAAQLTR